MIAEVEWRPRLAEFEAYARLSGDDNPIHLDPAFAARHPFGRPVSHGMLLHAQLCALAERVGQAPALQAKLVFPAPAYAGEPLRLTLEASAEDASETGVLARARRLDGTLVCDALWAVAPPAPLPLLPSPAPEARLERAFGADDLAQFAGLTGAGASAQVPGALIGGLFSCLLGTRLPGPGTGWLRQELHHSAAAEIGELLTARVLLLKRRPDRPLADLMCICTGNEGRLICHGPALMLLSSSSALQS